MKIGLNGQKLLSSNPAGPEKYTYNLYQTLAKIDTANDYVIYFDQEPSENFIKELTGGNTTFSFKVVHKTLAWTQVDLALELLKNPVDVFFTPIHTLPILHSPKLKIVAMLHGLEYATNKNTKSIFYSLLKGKHEWVVATVSDKIIVPSSATKSAILNKKWLGVTQNKIDIITEGVSDIFYKRTPDEITTVKSKYNLDLGTRYLIFVSTIQPRKNIPNMLEAYSKAINEHPELQNTKILLVGKTGWNFAESLEAPKKFGIEKNTIFMGRIPDDDLPPLMSGAEGYISCSLDEGFGLPLLEAMACETPCIVSAIPAHKELGGSFPTYVEPKSVSEISKAIWELFTKPKNITVILGAKKRANSYTWNQTASKTLSVLRAVTNQSNRL